MGTEKEACCKPARLTRRVAVGFLAVVAATLGAAAIESAGVSLIDFRLRGRGENDELAWELQGGRAVMQGTLIEIADLDLLLHQEDGTVTKVESPNCRFDRINNVGRSPASIRAVGESMILEGQGYDFLLEKHKMNLHSQVRMRIRHGGDSPFPRVPEEAGDESPPESRN